MPFEEALEFAARPSLSASRPTATSHLTLDAVAIAESVERQTGATVAYLPLTVPSDRVMRLFVTSRPGSAPLPFDVVWADPYTGDIRLAFTWGALGGGAQSIAPFLYRLHYGYVAGPWGVWAFGLAALVWTVDCFVGFGLTLPIRRGGTVSRPVRTWWAQWRPAWRIRRTRSFKLTFDLHRAGGLWLWPMLLVFAWSGVALTLPQVEHPVMTLFGATDGFQPPARATPLAAPPIGRREAVARGLGALRKIGQQRGFAIDAPSMIAYNAGSGSYALYARTSLDVVSDGGRTVLWLDGTSGRVLHVDDPIGASPADRLMTWATMLHMAQVFGLPYRIATALFGLLVTGLSVTGVLIWLRKRSARLLTHARLPHR